MTGSGKTGLCLALIEEALLDGIPVLLIDPKGDLANLCLTFPQLRPEDFAPWVNEDDARRKGLARRRVRRPAGRALAEGAGGVGRGRRADPAAPRRGRRRHLHAGQHGGPAGLDRQVVRRAPAAVRDDAELFRERIAHHRDEPSRPPRDRGGPAPEPRAHPPREAPRGGVAGRPRPRPRCS